MLVLDGAMGTLLASQGVEMSSPAWTADAVRHHPEAVAAIHAAYAAAGATVHTAATFRTSPHIVGADAGPLTRAAVALARGHVPKGHRVLGSMAPIADCYRPDLSPAHSAAQHRAMADLLASTGVDGLLVETFANPTEAVQATRAAVSTGLPVWTSLTPGFDGTLLGPDALADAAERVYEAGAATVLVNCLPAARAEAWVAALSRAGVPWGIYANAGHGDDKMWHGRTGAAERYGAHASSWRTAGASVVGGCCGTGPDHIAAVMRLTIPQVGVDDDRSLE